MIGPFSETAGCRPPPRFVSFGEVAGVSEGGGRLDEGRHGELEKHPRVVVLEEVEKATGGTRADSGVDDLGDNGEQRFEVRVNEFDDLELGVPPDAVSFLKISSARRVGEHLLNVEKEERI